jgi:spermidine/putrescine transport system permease protein
MNSKSGNGTDVGSRLPLLGWLPVLWYALFLLGPLVMVFAISLASRGVYGGIDWSLGGANFSRAFDSLYAFILVRSIWLAFVTGSMCLLIGLPMALAMATAPMRLRSVYVLLMAVPFLTNLIIRVCALKSFTSFDGPLASLLTALTVPFDPFSLSQNMPLVMYGMISTYLPFMVFPLYGALERFDFSLVEAAQDLGASYTQVLMRVIVPCLRKAIVSGILLVFIPALGEFVIPDLLGGAKAMLIGNLISEQFLKSRDWPFGAALSVLMMLLLGASVFLIRLFEGREGVAQ